MLTVVTVASHSRLTTVERVRAELGLPDDASNLAMVEARIDEASRAAVDYCRRSFGLETIRETLRGRELGEIYLSRDPLVGAAAVTLDGKAVDPGGLEVDPETGELRRLSGFRAVPWRGSAMTIEYQAGYTLPGQADPTLPATVERAVIALISAYASIAGRDAAVRSETVDGVGSTTWWVLGTADTLISPEAQQLLQPYRRVAWSVG